MLLFESDNANKKICIWKDEMPINYVGKKKQCICIESHTNDIKWHVGTIGIEVKLHPRHVSNYAMIFIKYTNNINNETQITVQYGGENNLIKSQVLPFNKLVCVGLDEEFAEAICEFFVEYSQELLPSGTIEVLSGGYDNVGSSNLAFKKAMELLLFIFRHIDEMSDNELQRELLLLI